MLALAEILALVILNALLHAAFTRWRIARRTGRPQRRAKVRIAPHYPLHPSPTLAVAQCEAAPEHAAQIRPAGIDW